MYIQVRLKNRGWTKVYLQPDSKDKDLFYLVLAADCVASPIITLKREDNKLSVIKLSDDVEEDREELAGKLSDLAMRIDEAEKQGVDLSEIDGEAGEKVAKPYDPNKIRVEQKVFSLRQIYDMINSGDLDISPDFQRNEVWDNFRKSRLIESILLRIPLPVFYFSEDEKGVLSVVDGLQRLSAVKAFMDNELKLKDLEYLDNCEGKCYSAENNCVEDKYKRWFNATQISANVITADSPYQVKFDVFRRLNTGGKPLNSQELRNCLMNTAVRDLLRGMSSSSSFKEATGNSIDDGRMTGQEMAMRFIYFYNLYNKGQLQEYNGQIDECLDSLVEELRKLSIEQLEKYYTKYDTAMRNAFYLFGRHAFRKVNGFTVNDSPRSLINKALFVAWAVILSEYDKELIEATFERNSFINILGNAIDEDESFFNYLSYGTNGAKNIRYVFDKVSKIMSANMLAYE